MMRVVFLAVLAIFCLVIEQVIMLSLIYVHFFLQQKYDRALYITKYITANADARLKYINTYVNLEYIVLLVFHVIYQTREGVFDMASQMINNSWRNSTLKLAKFYGS